MKVFGINDGHTIKGPGSGAVGRISESEHTRLVGAEVRRLFKQEGQRIVNCTIDYSSSTSENLNLIVQQSNRQDLDWFISIHFNAAGGKGVEVYTYEGRQYQDAINVCDNISKVLNIPNRGVKAGTGLYVIRKTKAKSMLIEVCFVDSDDADKYLVVGHEVVAKAIVEGVLGVIKENDNALIPEQKPVETPVVNPAPSLNWTLRLQKELNRQGFKDKNGNRLVEDGYPGPLTLSACPTLKQGAKGNITKLLQEKLGISADGIFGSNTKATVINYQKSKGLVADGIVGKATWKFMLGIS